MTTTESNDLVAVVQADHGEIKSLMQQVATKSSDRQATFTRLVAKIATHETAEEEVVHPLTRRAQNGSTIVDARLEEESKGKAALAKLEKMGVDDPAFDAEFTKLQSEVLAHAQHEEQEEHPLLRTNFDAAQLQKAATTFRKAESIAPTHAHAHSPESATGNVVGGTFVAIADRVRDALRREK